MRKNFLKKTGKLSSTNLDIQWMEMQITSKLDRNLSLPVNGSRYSSSWNVGQNPSIESIL